MREKNIKEIKKIELEFYKELNKHTKKNSN